MAYCITHELNNVAWAGEDFGCLITSCPPPELSPAWIDFVVEPSEAELIEMDMNAEVLEADLLEV